MHRRAFVPSFDHCFVDSSRHWFIDWLMHWFIASLTQWMSVHAFIDSLINRLIDQVVHCFIQSAAHVSMNLQDFNASLFLHLKNFPIYSWIFVMVRNFRPGAGQALVVRKHTTKLCKNWEKRLSNIHWYTLWSFVHWMSWWHLLAWEKRIDFYQWWRRLYDLLITCRRSYEMKNF